MFSKDFDKFDEDTNRMQKFAVAWLVFIALVILAILGGTGFVVFKLLAHFGIL